MTDTNVSFYNQPNNALTQLGQVSGIANQVNQNRLFQSTFAGQKAMGDIFQQSVDPTTGMFNPAIAAQLGKNNPNAAYIMPDLIQKGLQLNQQKQQNQISAAQLTLQHAPQLQAAAMEVYNDPTKEKARSTLIGMVDPDPSNPSPGKVSAQEVVKQLQELEGLGDDPNAIKNWAMQHAKQQEVLIHGAKAVLPEMSYQDTGGGLRPVNTNPMSDSFNANQNVAKTLPPTTSVYNAKGQAHYVGSPEAKAGSIAASQIAPVDMNAAPTNTTRPNPPSAEQFSEAPPGTKETGVDNAAQALSLQRAAATTPQQKALLGSMEGKLGDFSSGPGSAAWKEIAAGAQRLYGGNSQSIASQEDFNKMASMIAQQQFQSLGGTGTDAKLDSAMSTSPNTFLSERGNKEIIHLLKGNADAISVMNNEWQNAKKPVSEGGQGLLPQDFGKFQTDFNKQYDPRAFQLQYMEPKERKDLLKGMSDAEKKQFANAVNVAGEKGWIPDLRSQNAK